MTILVGTLAFPGLACKQQRLEPDHTAGYIVGTGNDIKNVGGDGADARAEVAQLSPEALLGAVLIATRLSDKRVKFCSGSLIAGESPNDNYRVLTNHHCFAETDGEAKATRTTLPEACTNTKVYFGYIAGQTDKATSIPCEAGSLRTNFEGDIGVFSLSQNPPEKYKPLQLWDGEDAPEGRQAAIVHYPDTEEFMAVPKDGGAKLPTAAVTFNDCKVEGAFAISEWDLDRTLPFSLRHTCDLIHGSSGSGLIDVKTSQILGVNWGGIKISFDDGTRTDNVATKASYVLAFLNGTQTEVIKAAEGKRRDADLAAAQKDEGFKEKSQNAAEKVKKSCGVVEGPSGRFSFALLMLGLVLPWLTLRRARRN